MFYIFRLITAKKEHIIIESSLQEMNSLKIFSKTFMRQYVIGLCKILQRQASVQPLNLIHFYFLLYSVQEQIIGTVKTVKLPFLKELHVLGRHEHDYKMPVSLYGTQILRSHQRENYRTELQEILYLVASQHKLVLIRFQCISSKDFAVARKFQFL